MPMLGIREFARSVSKVIDSVTEDREPVIITRHGRPAVAILPLDPDRWQSLAIAAAPQLLRSLRAADVELASGAMQSLDDALVEWDSDLESSPESRPTRRQPKRPAARRNTRKEAVAAKPSKAKGTVLAAKAARNSEAAASGKAPARAATTASTRSRTKSTTTARSRKSGEAKSRSRKAKTGTAAKTTRGAKA
jgi:prevent-host-death family protein